MATARSWYHPGAIIESVMLRPRVYLAAIAGTISFFACPSAWPSAVRTSVALEASGLVYLFVALRIMYFCGPDHIKTVAGTRDDSRIVILTVILLAICASFGAIALLIGYAKQPTVESREQIYLGILAMLTIVTSWSVTQVSFALHYAHEYYLPAIGSDAKGGLMFPNCDAPDYWDFLYFSTSIGATSQTSDISIASHNLRRLVTLHAVTAFFFNTAVLALTVNIAASIV